MSSGVFSTSPRLIPRYASDPTGRLMKDSYDEKAHRALTERALRNQAYYDGSQYDDENETTLATLQKENPDLALLVLPEHERINPTSGHIAECVDFLADQLTDGFAFECDDDGVQEIVEKAIDASDLLKNGSDEEVAIDNLIVQAAVKGDVPYQLLWDPVEQTGYFEFWEAQQVEFDVPSGRYVRGVTAKYRRWVKKDDGKGNVTETEVEQKEVYDLQPHLEPVFAPAQEVPGPIGPSARPSTSEPVDYALVAPLECRRRVYWDGDPEEEPRETHWLGIPFIPWEVIRVYQEGTYGFRGVPLVNEKAIGNARRFDANEQQAYITTRFNAHATIVAVGDQVTLRMDRNPVVRKDLADVVTFPGGTDAKVMQLTTDAAMIDHVHDVSADAIYQSFGLTRVDQDTISGLGAPSGYALEILNRRSEGKLKRVRRTCKTDLVRAVDLLLNLTAYRKAAVIPETDPVVDLLADDPELDPDLFVEPVPGWSNIDPAQVFSNRDMEIRMGSGFIVDDVQIRDDFTAGLISQQEALRQRGYSEIEIEDMMEEKFAGAGGSISVDASGALIGADGAPLTGEALKAAQEQQNIAGAEHEAKQGDRQAKLDERSKSDTKSGKAVGTSARQSSSTSRKQTTRTRR